MCHVNQGQRAFVHTIGVVLPAAQHGVLHLFDNALFDLSVRDRVRGHVKQQKVLLLGGQHALFHQVFRQALAYVAQLKFKLERIPCLTTEQLHPVLDSLARLRGTDVFERFI
eukprot:TRINITY_DN11528_c0_g1_i5.p3 TRINITY_DN11528_c0_g1~~TRINITY_DN11528_c0_g1_i5.p3  ORF type:complete len:112 (-),score=2.05 TRINITY_DN11528_c0_g1_i5:517-852(-)